MSEIVFKSRWVGPEFARDWKDHILLKVPEENWLPIERKDLELNIILRVYAPDLQKIKTWEAPKAESLK